MTCILNPQSLMRKKIEWGIYVNFPGLGRSWKKQWKISRKPDWQRKVVTPKFNPRRSVEILPKTYVSERKISLFQKGATLKHVFLIRPQHLEASNEHFVWSRRKGEAMFSPLAAPWQFSGHLIFDKNCFFWKFFFEKILKKISQFFDRRKTFWNFAKKIFEKKFAKKTFCFKKTKVLYRGKKIKSPLNCPFQKTDTFTFPRISITTVTPPPPKDATFSLPN